jgi:hypothetical protein
MSYTLSFNLAREPVCKRVSFATKQLKDEYVDAEYKDPLCRSLWLRYQCAVKAERPAAAKELDAARYAFYKSWEAASAPRRDNAA